MRFSIIDHLGARPHTHRTHGGAASVSDTGLPGAPARVATAECTAAARMPPAARRRCRRPALVAAQLPARLHLLQLGPSHAPPVAALRDACARARAARRAVLAGAAARPHRAPPRAAERVSISFTWRWF